MNLLLDRTPLCVSIEGNLWDINADFRIAILFEQLLNDTEINEMDKIQLALQLYFPTIPNELNQAINKIIWFYRCGKDAQVSKHKSTIQSKPLYDFEQDSDMIYAAFKSDYGVDLETIKFLHWWKFKAMFENLRSDNHICKVMEFRGADTRKMKGEQKAFYSKMQKQYAIKRPKVEQEREDRINDILLNSGDLSMLENLS